MKIPLFTLLFLCFTTLFYAQESDKTLHNAFIVPEKYLKLELSTGAAFDLMHRGSNQKYNLISGKPATVPAFGLKSTHFFARKWGWYAQVQFNFYNTKRAEGLWTDHAGDFFGGFAKALFFPASLLKPSVDAGLVYRMETARWRIHPQIGVGWLCYLENKNSGKSNTHKQETRSVKYEQSATPLVANMGLSINYFLNNRIYWLLNANFQQPLQKSWARMTHFVNDVETEKITQRSITAGRNINVHVGFGFCPWIKP